MSNEVFANGNEIACKSGDGKSIAAFPDVCLSPPSPPAGPIPVPYPNTSFSKDTKKGSKKVKIDGEEVMLKDKSFYKSSPLGNEAATKSFGSGVVSHVITGKTYFVAWSMDVKFEGQNVDRHIDLTTTNHASPMSNGGITPEGEEGAGDGGDEEQKCECCGGPMHSEAQKKGDSMPPSKFYEPPSASDREPSDDQKQAFKDMEQYRWLAKELECENLHSDEDDDSECAKHYPGVDKEDKKDIDQEYETMTSSGNRKWNKEWFIGQYGEKVAEEVIARGERLAAEMAAVKGGGSSIAHVTPRAAGGCPVGEENLKVVSGDCYELEKEMGTAQKHVMDYRNGK